MLQRNQLSLSILSLALLLLVSGVAFGNAGCYGTVSLAGLRGVDVVTDYENGMEAYDNENWEKAAEYLSKVSEEHENYTKAQVHLAVAQGHLGKWEAARSTLYAAYKKDDRALWDHEDEVQKMGILDRKERQVDAISTSVPLEAIEIHGDTMTATTRKHVISVWDLKTGSLLWEQSLGDLRGTPELPSMCEGNVFAVRDVTGRSSELAAFDAETGARQWTVDLGGISEEMNTDCADGTVYVSMHRKGKKKIAAVDANSGRVARKMPLSKGGRDLLQVAVAGDLVCGHDHDDTVYCADRNSGELVFERGLRDLTDSTPIVGDGNSIYIPARGQIYAFAIDEQRPRKWTYSLDYKQSGLTLDESRGRLYVTGGEDRALKAISTRTGNEKWSVRPPGVNIAAEQAPRVVDGEVLASTKTGAFAVNAESGSLAWYVGFEGAEGVVPDVREGVVYAPNHDDPENQLVGWKPQSWQQALSEETKQAAAETSSGDESERVN